MILGTNMRKQFIDSISNSARTFREEESASPRDNTLRQCFLGPRGRGKCKVNTQLTLRIHGQKRIPSRSLTARPLKSYRNPIGKNVVFQPPFFRGELLNFRGVFIPTNFSIKIHRSRKYSVRAMDPIGTKRSPKTLNHVS